MASLTCAPVARCVAPSSAQQQRRSRRCLVVRADAQQGKEPSSGSGSGGSSGRPEASPPPPLPSLADPAGVVVYGGRLPPTRRLLISGLSAAAVGELNKLNNVPFISEEPLTPPLLPPPFSNQAQRAVLIVALSPLPPPPAALGGNLFGLSSFLLSLDGGKLAESSRLDVLWPVNGSRRCLDTGNGYTFVYPAKWLADQTLYRRYAERIEREAALDPPTLRREQARRQNAAEPTAAFGPAGSTGEQAAGCGGRQRSWLACALLHRHQARHPAKATCHLNRAWPLPTPLPCPTLPHSCPACR